MNNYLNLLLRNKPFMKDRGLRYWIRINAHRFLPTIMVFAIELYSRIIMNTEALLERAKFRSLAIAFCILVHALYIMLLK
jgi:hypothetical protein